MSDLSQVRAEIKCWERNFKAKHARDPSVQDIKEQPEIAEKYKRYKKLSKAATVTAVFSNASKPSEPPSTPPRSHARNAPSSAILSKKRVVEHTAPLSSFNPFSPVKQKGKQKDTTRFQQDSRSNPFATPSKLKPQPAGMRDPSPDLFPSIQPSRTHPPVSNSSIPVKGPTSPLSRARKRLRGEPVSPSPYKEKRQRVNSQVSLPFPLPSALSEGSDDHDDAPTNSSFVNDSPVKASAGGKTFKLLFDEPVPQNEAQTKSKGKWSRSKTTPNPMDPHRTVVKRRLSDTDVEQKDIIHNTTSISQLPLLRPSPPPADSSYGSYSNNKSKVKERRRKRAKVAEELDGGSEDDGHQESSKVKLVDLRQGVVHQPPDSHDDIYLDPVLHLPTASVTSVEDGSDAAEMHINLPDRLRHVLAITPSNTQDVKEERLVHGLLYGRRVTRYDPVKGGEIWDVGEEGEQVPSDPDAEDDWEGEPVPWEVGEL